MEVLKSCPQRKRALGRLVAASGWTRIARANERRRPALRVVNYHGTPPRARAGFARQVDRLLSRYRALDPFELETTLRDGCELPSILFTFDDGLAVHRAVAAEVLEEHGVRGVFCIPSAYPDIPAAEQRQWFTERIYPVPTELHVDAEDTTALTWDGARDLLARGHRICSHTRSHERLAESTPDATLEAEVMGSRADLERALGTSVTGFCWPVAFDPLALAADRLVRETYEWAFAGPAGAVRRAADPFRIGRTNLEASWARDVVDLQLSGVVDLWARR